jgi:SAM-dependent methyltransferase
MTAEDVLETGELLAEDQLFLETTRRLAPPRLASLDVRTALRLLEADPREPVADLGCGYGRHLLPLLEQGRVKVIGIDRSALLLREAKKLVPQASLLRGDLRALPLARGTLGGATCFYSSFALGTHADARAALAEIARVLKPGARLVITTDNPLRLEASPESDFVEEVPGLGRVAERSRFDARERVDVVERSLVRPDGERLAATWRIRYFLPGELAELARLSGLTFLRLDPGARLSRDTPQLTALFERARGRM